MNLLAKLKEWVVEDNVGVYADLSYSGYTVLPKVDFWSFRYLRRLWFFTLSVEFPPPQKTELLLARLIVRFPNSGTLLSYVADEGYIFIFFFIFFSRKYVSIVYFNGYLFLCLLYNYRIIICEIIWDCTRVVCFAILCTTMYLLKVNTHNYRGYWRIILRLWRWQRARDPFAVDELSDRLALALNRWNPERGQPQGSSLINIQHWPHCSDVHKQWNVIFYGMRIGDERWRY